MLAPLKYVLFATRTLPVYAGDHSPFAKLPSYVKDRSLSTLRLIQALSYAQPQPGVSTQPIQPQPSQSWPLPPISCVLPALCEPFPVLTTFSLPFDAAIQALLRSSIGFSPVKLHNQASTLCPSAALP